MKQVKLGSQGLVVSAEGLGCMGMSAFYGPSDEAENLATLARAIELGITFLRYGGDLRAVQERDSS